MTTTKTPTVQLLKTLVKGIVDAKTIEAKKAGVKNPNRAAMGVTVTGVVLNVWKTKSPALYAAYCTETGTN